MQYDIVQLSSNYERVEYHRVVGGVQRWKYANRRDHVSFKWVLGCISNSHGEVAQ